jgi:hypothetical protein
MSLDRQGARRDLDDRLRSTSSSTGSRSLERSLAMSAENKRLEDINQRIRDMGLAKERLPSALSPDEWKSYRSCLEVLKCVLPNTNEHMQIEQKIFAYEIQVHTAKESKPLDSGSSDSGSSDSGSSDSGLSDITLDQNIHEFDVFALKNISRSIINAWVDFKGRNEVYTDKFMLKAQSCAIILKKFKDKGIPVDTRNHDTDTLDALNAIKSFDDTIRKRYVSLNEEQMQSANDQVLNLRLLKDTYGDLDDLTERFIEIRESSE